MKKLLIGFTAIGMALGVLTIAGTSWGQEVEPPKTKLFSISVGTQRTPKKASIRLFVEDAKPKSGVCPYYVRSFEYLPAVNLIAIEVFQETCANEAYGFSRGEAIWMAPQGLQTRGSKISVLVNQTLAGTLNYDERTQMFNVTGN